MHATNRLAIAVCLCLFLAATLFLTYGGAFVSDDEVILFDATESLARRGNLGLNLTVNLRDSPVLDSEPMQAIAAAPLFWLVERVPGVGMAHGVLIFNNLVTSLTAGLFFLYATALGYRAGAAALAALLFGVATIAWPYSKAFFREPLTGFFLLLTAYALERWRPAFAIRRAHRRWIALGGAAFVASLFTKEAILFALPALVLLILPGITRPRRGRACRLVARTPARDRRRPARHCRRRGLPGRVWVAGRSTGPACAAAPARMAP
ncbi:MAG: phospholipid carrier-dependent glycosyltransferase [Anaerolineae bacterium]|nr:phospholipid carrier-dependent glycosyltransferase [Anaerolineae bacterium]